MVPAERQTPAVARELTELSTAPSPWIYYTTPAWMRTPLSQLANPISVAMKLTANGNTATPGTGNTSWLAVLHALFIIGLFLLLIFLPRHRRLQHVPQIRPDRSPIAVLRDQLLIDPAGVPGAFETAFVLFFRLAVPAGSVGTSQHLPPFAADEQHEFATGRALGARDIVGFVDSCVLAQELTNRGLRVERQVPVAESYMRS